MARHELKELRAFFALYRKRSLIILFLIDEITESLTTQQKKLFQVLILAYCFHDKGEVIQTKILPRRLKHAAREAVEKGLLKGQANNYKITRAGRKFVDSKANFLNESLKKYNALFQS